jgi:hypothetical protein
MVEGDQYALDAHELVWPDYDNDWHNANKYFVAPNSNQHYYTKILGVLWSQWFDSF